MSSRAEGTAQSGAVYKDTDVVKVERGAGTVLSLALQRCRGLFSARVGHSVAPCSGKERCAVLKKGKGRLEESTR